MEKSEKFRLLYSIFLGLFTVAVGIAIICVAADIYYSGKDTGVIYTREIVSEKLLSLAIPLIFLIAAIIFGAIFPLYRVKAKRQPEETLKRLKNKIPQAGEKNEYSLALSAYKKAATARIVSWLVALTVALVAAIVTLCYLVNTANFVGEEITEEIFAMMRYILPWFAVSFAAAISATLVCGVFANLEVSTAKIMIITGDKDSGTKSPELAVITKTKAMLSKPAFAWIGKSVAAVKSAWNKPTFIWAVRGALFAIAVVFIVLGIVNGGAKDVLIKAINICTECIGLG
ncbi:MAG: hypothetical protein J1F71_06985 [Clostridiales bacterium]|nr:hypothetical protein [Clostridiales bacterium]